MSQTISYELDNGLKVLLAPSDAAPVVAIQAWVQVGSADESAEEAGLAHFHEHMLFKGTQRRGVGQIAQEVEGHGGQINAWTSFEQTTYHLVLPSEALDQGLDILSDILGHSAFDAEELSKESEVILEEIKQGKDNPGQKLSQAMFSETFKAHPYRRPIIGTEETVRSFQREDLLRFYRKWYAPNNIVLVVAGAFEEAATKEQIKTLFGPREASSSTHERTQEPQPEGLRLKALQEDIQESQLQIAFRIPPALHEDIYALEALAVILGQGQSSRLFHELERNRRCVNGISSYVYALREAGLFVISAAVPEGSEEQALQGILEQIALLQQRPPSRQEVDKAITSIESDAVYLRQSVQGMARTLGYYQSMAGDYRFEETFYKEIAGVQRRDIQRVAKEHLLLDRAVICLMTPQHAEETYELDQEKIEAYNASLQPYEGDEAPAIVGMAQGVQRIVLGNGVRLVLKEVSHAPMASIRAAMQGGLRAETKENNGISMLSAQLLTNGTNSFDAIELARTIDGMAGSLGGFAGRNSLGLQGEFLTKTFDRGLELFAECLLAPQFPEPEIERMRRLFLEDIKAQEDQPAYQTFRAFSKTLFPTHPYGLPSSGSAESISALTREQLQGFYQGLLNPENLVVSIVGDIDPEEVAFRLDTMLGGMAAEPFEAPAPSLDAPPEEIRRVLLHKDKLQAHIFLGFMGTTIYKPDHYAFQVLNEVLAGQGGRLFLELRDKMSLAYSVSSTSLELLDPGCFAVYIATSPNKVETAIQAILEQLARVQEEEIPAEERRRVQQSLAGAHAISLQYNSAQSMSYALNELYGLGYAYGEQFPEAIKAVTSDQMQAVAKQYMPLDRYVLSVTMPEQQDT